MSTKSVCECVREHEFVCESVCVKIMGEYEKCVGEICECVCTVSFPFSHSALFFSIRINQLQLSVNRWQRLSQICFATFIWGKSQIC
jgi:hypothetical protein